MKVLIIGSSSGIGLECAKLLINNNFEVAGASKSVADAEFPQYLMDVRDSSAIAEVMRKNGKFDALIYCAGIGLASPAAETTRKDYSNLFDVNFFGLCECVKSALPQLSDGGRIIAVSSMAGVMPVPFNAFYNASKAALNSYIMSLAHELKPRRISATAVMPGGTRTEFSKKRKKYTTENEDYDDALSQSIHKLTNEEQHGIEPERVAAAILEILVSDKPPLLAPVGAEYKAYYLMEKILPKKFMNKIIETKYLN